MRQALVLALLAGIWGSNPTFQQLIAAPADFVTSSDTFEQGVAVCTKRDRRPQQQGGVVLVTVAALAKDGKPDMSKMIGMRVREDVAHEAAVRPGAVITAVGTVQGNKGKFWIDAESVEVTRRIQLHDTPEGDCDKLMGALEKKDNKLQAVLLGAALGSIGTLATREVSQPMSP